MNSYYLNLRKKIGQDLIVYPSVAACIKNEKNEILLVRKKGSNIWGFPAGGVEPNETIEEALKREVKEETNKDVIPEKLIAIYSSPNFDFNYENGDKIHPIIFFFKCHVKNKDSFKKNPEIEEIKYFPKNDLPFSNMRKCCQQKALDCFMANKQLLVR